MGTPKYAKEEGSFEEMAENADQVEVTIDPTTGKPLIIDLTDGVKIDETTE